jgi:uncharacterized protein YecE (DUF72 family)
MSPPVQPSLFGDEPAAPPRPELERLAARIPPSIKFGTSTWTYDGWSGDVYHRFYKGPQPARRLEEYARYPLFRTVGIDSALYGPPSEDALRDYARALPQGFPCVIKVWDRITAKRPGPNRRRGAPGGTKNPDFLNAELFKDAVLLPYARTFRDHAGVFVFEFQTMRGNDLPDPAAWADQLHEFLAQLPADFRYAVELRNTELLTDLHGAVLKEHGVAHVFNSWREAPPIGAQLDLSWRFPAGFTVARALLKPGRSFADAVKLFEPYDRVREELPDLRESLLRLLVEAQHRRLEAFILASNRAEGNAPGTIRAVAEMWENQGEAGVGRRA